MTINEWLLLHWVHHLKRLISTITVWDSQNATVQTMSTTATNSILINKVRCASMVPQNTILPSFEGTDCVLKSWKFIKCHCYCATVFMRLQYIIRYDPSMRMVQHPQLRVSTTPPPLVSTFSYTHHILTPSPQHISSETE